MKVTNTSAAPQKVRGVEGVVEIKPGMSRQMELSADHLARIRERSGLTVEDEKQAATKPKSAKVD